jgi:hypothetical protein
MRERDPEQAERGLGRNSQRVAEVGCAHRRLARGGGGPATVLMATVLLLLGAARLGGQHPEIYDSGGPLLAEQAAYDVTFYELSLRVDPAERSIAGAVTTVAEVVAPMRHLVLDLDTLLTVAAVHEAVADRPLGWERRGGRLWIELGAV